MNKTTHTIGNMKDMEQRWCISLIKPFKLIESLARALQRRNFGANVTILKIILMDFAIKKIRIAKFTVTFI